MSKNKVPLKFPNILINCLLTLYCLHIFKNKMYFKIGFFLNQGISSHKKGTKYNNKFTTTHCKGSNMILELVRVRIQVYDFFLPHFWFSIWCFNLQIMKVQIKVNIVCLFYVSANTYSKNSYQQLWYKKFENVQENEIK